MMRRFLGGSQGSCRILLFLSALVVAEGDHGVDTGGAPGGRPGGEQGQEAEQGGDEGVGEGIEGAGFKEESGHEFGFCVGGYHVSRGASPDDPQVPDFRAKHRIGRQFLSLELLKPSEKGPNGIATQFR